MNEYIMKPLDLMIATPTLSLQETMGAYVNVCMALLVTMLMISIGVGYGLSRIVVHPIRSIRETANRIGSHNLSQRIQVSDVKDEISDLARLLNQMFDRLERAFEQVRRFSDEASHELKTPLSLIHLHAEKMLSDGGLPDRFTEAVVVQIEEVTRLNQIIDELLFLSRAEAKAVPFRFKLQDPGRFLGSFNQDAVVLTEHYGCRFTCSHSGSGEVEIEEKWLRQVLLNVLTNALNVSPPNGLITLTSEIDATAWTVSLEDEGPGLPREQRERIFERFVRLGAPRSGDRGSGLGLAISRSVVELHGGRIDAFQATAGLGLRLTFVIPTAVRAA